MKKTVSKVKEKANKLAEKYPKTTKAAKFVGKRALPVMSAYGIGSAIKEKRYGDIVGEAAWMTIPTGVMYEVGAMAVEQNKGKPIPKGAQVRFGLGPDGKPRGGRK